MQHHENTPGRPSSKLACHVHDIFPWLMQFVKIRVLTSLLFVVSITKFSIVIGSLQAYLLRIWCMITWVSNYRCPILTFCNWIPM